MNRLCFKSVKEVMSIKAAQLNSLILIIEMGILRDMARSNFHQF